MYDLWGGDRITITSFYIKCVHLCARPGDSLILRARLSFSLSFWRSHFRALKIFTQLAFYFNAPNTIILVHSMCLCIFIFICITFAFVLSVGRKRKVKAPLPLFAVRTHTNMLIYMHNYKACALHLIFKYNLLYFCRRGAIVRFSSSSSYFILVIH